MSFYYIKRLKINKDLQVYLDYADSSISDYNGNLVWHENQYADRMKFTSLERL